MFKFSSLVVGIFLTVVVSAAANKDVHVMADEVSVISESNADKVIPVVQTIGGVATTFFYTIIDEQTIVNDDQSSLISGVDDDLAAYPNIANAMRNMDAFEDMLARILKENPEFGIINSASEQT